MKRILTYLSAALLLSLASCKHDSDTNTNGPEEPVVAPTAYVFDIPSYFPAIVPAPADNPTTVEGVELGRHLFYETALSLDNTVACASCHRQELAFTDGRAHPVGVAGALSPRNAMSLTNLLWEPKLTWDGAATSLETQARIPIEKPVEMHQTLAAGVAKLQNIAIYPPMFRKAFGSSTITEDNALKALAQFERTLISSNSRYDQLKKGNRTIFTADEEAGRRLFDTHPDALLRIRGGNCSDCHVGELQHEITATFRNNGLDATLTDLGLGALTGLPTDNGRFRVPSLRNIALTAPYMHDGRFTTLEQVLDHYNEHIAFASPNIDPLILNASNSSATPGSSLGLTADEKAKIIIFLHTLTDTTFTHDRRFAKP